MKTTEPALCESYSKIRVIFIYSIYALLKPDKKHLIYQPEHRSFNIKFFTACFLCELIFFISSIF